MRCGAFNAVGGKIQSYMYIAVVLWNVAILYTVRQRCLSEVEIS